MYQHHQKLLQGHFFAPKASKTTLVFYHNDKEAFSLLLPSALSCAGNRVQPENIN